MIKQVQKKVDNSEKALIMTEINRDEVKIITNSGIFQDISEEIKKLHNGREIKTEMAIARVTDIHVQTDKNNVPFLIKTEFRVNNLVTRIQHKAVLHTSLSL